MQGADDTDEDSNEKNGSDDDLEEDRTTTRSGRVTTMPGWMARDYVSLSMDEVEPRETTLAHMASMVDEAHEETAVAAGIGGGLDDTDELRRKPRSVSPKTFFT